MNLITLRQTTHGKERAITNVPTIDTMTNSTLYTAKTLLFVTRLFTHMEEHDLTESEYIELPPSCPTWTS